MVSYVIIRLFTLLQKASLFANVFTALGVYQVTRSNRNFCPSVCLSVGLSVPVLLFQALPDKVRR